MKLTRGEFLPAKQHECHIITQQEREDENGVTFYNGDIAELIYKLKTEQGKNIFCNGGAQIVKLLMEKDLIDEYRISISPIILGDGKQLFKRGTQIINLKALPSKQYESGLVHLRYEKK